VLPAPQAPAAPPVAVAQVATLILLPTLTRDGGSPPTLALGKATEVRLQLVVEPAEYQGYRVAIRNAGGTEIWRT
jgi:hypothetical protein